MGIVNGPMQDLGAMGIPNWPMQDLGAMGYTASLSYCVSGNIQRPSLADEAGFKNSIQHQVSLQQSIVGRLGSEDRSLLVWGWGAGSGLPTGKAALICNDFGEGEAVLIFLN